MAQSETALLLLGGGARAAYQVGVLKAIALHHRGHKGLPFKILCGTSAGAINAASLACYASYFPLAVKKMEWVWKNFRTDNVYTSNLKNFYRAVAINLSTPSKSANYQQTISLLDNTPLISLLQKMLDLKRIEQHLKRGYLSGVSITASSYQSGDSVNFFQSADNLQSWQRAKRRGVRCELGVDHLLASTAIPMIFPSVLLGDEYFADGSVHQYAPLSPAIHLGAKKVLVIGMDQPNKKSANAAPVPPTGGAILGHLLDSVFSEALTLDIERMEQINRTLASLPSTERGKIPLKNISALQIHPSQSFDEIALRHYHKMPFSVRSMLRILGINKKTAANSSLVSYLLFEADFCRELIDLGFQDGLSRRSEIDDFLAD